ncbi:hypothetical protein A3Q56_08598, partial [Intoshia linei]
MFAYVDSTSAKFSAVHYRWLELWQKAFYVGVENRNTAFQITFTCTSGGCLTITTSTLIPCWYIVLGHYTEQLDETLELCLRFST